MLKKKKKNCSVSGTTIQIVLMICNFKEDRPGLLLRMPSVHSHLRLLEAASPRLKLRNEESPATALSFHKFSITMMSWEVGKVKPGNECIRDTFVGMWAHTVLVI